MAEKKIHDQKRERKRQTSGKKQSIWEEDFDPIL